MPQKRPQKRYMLSSDSSNRVAAEFLRLWGIGKPPNKHETTHLRRSGNGWFLQFVCTNALLASSKSSIKKADRESWDP